MGMRSFGWYYLSSIQITDLNLHKLTFLSRCVIIPLHMLNAWTNLHSSQISESVPCFRGTFVARLPDKGWLQLMSQLKKDRLSQTWLPRKTINRMNKTWLFNEGKLSFPQADIFVCLVWVELRQRTQYRVFEEVNIPVLNKLTTSKEVNG